MQGDGTRPSTRVRRSCGRAARAGQEWRRRCKVTANSAAYGASATATAYVPSETLATAITTLQTSFETQSGSGAGGIAVGQVIQIGSEQMLVTGVTFLGLRRSKS